MSNVSFEIGEDGDYHLFADVSGSKVNLQTFPAYDIDTQIGAATEAAAAAQSASPAPEAPAETPTLPEAPEPAEGEPAPEATPA